MNDGIYTLAPSQTKNIASQMAKNYKNGCLICLYGDLGSGKTVFAKGFATSLGIPEKSIKSPTYTFLREYKTKKGNFYHFDFYRIEESDDLLNKSLEEIFSRKNNWIVIEWADRIRSILPDKRIDVHFEYIDQFTRKITVNR